MENDQELEVESDDYQRGYLNALSFQQSKYTLRGHDVPINPPLKKTVQQKEAPPKQVQNKGKNIVGMNQNIRSQPSTSAPIKERDIPRKEVAPRYHVEKRDAIIKQVHKIIPFNLELEISKLKVFIHLTELVKIDKYKTHVVKNLKFDPLSDILTIEDD